MVEVQGKKKVLIIYQRINGSFGLMLENYDPNMENWTKCLMVINDIRNNTNTKNLTLEIAAVHPCYLEEYQKRIKLNTMLFCRKNDLVFSIKERREKYITKHPEVPESYYSNKENIYTPKIINNEQTDINILNCPICKNSEIYKNGTNLLKSKIRVQKYYCKKCGKSFQNKCNT